jgi:hypothetical protein
MNEEKVPADLAENGSADRDWTATSLNHPVFSDNHGR